MSPACSSIASRQRPPLAASALGAFMMAVGFAAPASAVCPGLATSEGEVASLGETGDITLSDGAVLRLPQIDGVTAEALAGAGLGPGARIRHVRVRTEPDRWGRIIARVMIDAPEPSPSSPPSPAPNWLEERLVARGMARVRVAEDGRGCAGPLLLAEEKARRAMQGRWRGDWSVFKAGDTAAISAAAGGHATVTGRVLSVGERQQRTYFNFGRRWTEDFTVSLPRTMWMPLTARGVDATSLAGKTVRVRGLVVTSGGPMIMLAFPEQLEILD